MTAPETTPCENGPRCTVRVFEASINGRVSWFEADPHPEGIYQIEAPRWQGGPVRAVRLSVTQQFGKTGTLHRVHKCPARLRKR